MAAHEASASKTAGLGTYPEIFGVDDEAKAFVHVENIPPEWEDNADGNRKLR
jgi:hypothetical protein